MYKSNIKHPLVGWELIYQLANTPKEPLRLFCSKIVGLRHQMPDWDKDGVLALQEVATANILTMYN